MIPDRFEPVLAELTPLAERFAAAGHRLYLVGGAVRDLLIAGDRPVIPRRVGERPDVAHRPRLPVVDRLEEALHRRPDEAGRVEPRAPRRERVLGEAALQLGDQRGGVLHAREGLGEARIARQGRRLERAAERRPVAVGLDHDEEQPAAVRGRVAVPERVARRSAVVARHRLAGRERRREVGAQHVEAGLEERRLDVTAATVAVAEAHRGENRADQVRRGGVVADCGALQRRRRIGVAHHVHETGARPVRGVVECGAIGLVAAEPVAGDRADDERRPTREERLVVEAVADAPARQEVRDEHVGAVDEAQDRRAHRRLLEVEREAALAAVVAVECGALREIARVARVLGARAAVDLAARRRLDLHDVRAEIREDRAGRGYGDPVRDLDDPHAGERQRRVRAHGAGARIASTTRRSRPVFRIPCGTPSGATSIAPASSAISRPSSRQTPRPATT